MEYQALPMDLVRLPCGKDAVVNCANYFDFSTGKVRQMFSICEKVPDGATPPLYFADECEFIHRHEFKPYGQAKRCDCGEIYTTMADYMTPRHPVTYQ